MLNNTALPSLLRKELTAITESGLYENEEAFLSDAVRTFLAARPDLREVIACKMYERGDLSIGGAAEWSGVSVEEMKEALHRHGFIRRADENPAEIVAMAEETLKTAGRPVR